MNSFLGLLAVQLPKAITPTLAGLTVGACVGVFGFLAVLFLVGRGQRRAPEPRRDLAPVVAAPPYGSVEHGAPRAPTASFAPAPFAPSLPYAGHTEVLHRPALPSAFQPSTDLSARAFAKMYAPEADSSVELAPCPASSSARSVSVSAIVVVGDGAPAPRSSEPHPLSIIPSIPGSSSLSIAPMRAASFADLDLDEGQTEIAETVFDEPPQPRRRTDPPKIRPIAPSRPRFAGGPVPAPTPPPARVAASPRHPS